MWRGGPDCGTVSWRVEDSLSLLEQLPDSKFYRLLGCTYETTFSSKSSTNKRILTAELGSQVSDGYI